MIQLAKEEFSGRVVLNPMDNHGHWVISKIWTFLTLAQISTVSIISNKRSGFKCPSGGLQKHPVICTHQGTHPGWGWLWSHHCTRRYSSPWCWGSARSHRSQAWSDIHSHLCGLIEGPKTRGVICLLCTKMDSSSFKNLVCEYVTDLHCSKLKRYKRIFSKCALLSPFPSHLTPLLGSNHCYCQFLKYPSRDELCPYKQIQPFMHVPPPF